MWRKRIRSLDTLLQAKVIPLTRTQPVISMNTWAARGRTAAVPEVNRDANGILISTEWTNLPVRPSSLLLQT